jgi:hypothetical protein
MTMKQLWGKTKTVQHLTDLRLTTSNRFEALNDDETTMGENDEALNDDKATMGENEDGTASSAPTVSIDSGSHASSSTKPPAQLLASKITSTKASKPPPPSKYWSYEPISTEPRTEKGERMNDGPKSKAFFQVLPSKRTSYATLTPSSSTTTPVPTQPASTNASQVLLALLSAAPEAYNPELDILMSAIESGVTSQLCLLSSQRTSDLHSAHDNVYYNGPDPKSQKEIELLPPAQAQRYNDASIAEFHGMKRKKVMELVPRSAMPPGTVIYPSVVNWTTKKVLGVYSKTKFRICFGGHRYDKTYTDCFAPTLNFNSVLMVICFAAIFGWR